MSIMKRFTMKNLRLNKKRSIVTIIGIILSTALICATAGLVTSFQKTLIDEEIKTEGSHHVLLKNVPQTDLNDILKNRYVKDSYKYSLLGYAYLKESKNEAKPYVKVLEFDFNALTNAGITLTKGRMPKNSNEVLVSSHVLENGGVKYNIGDKISLEIGERITDSGLNNLSDHYETDEEGNSVEKLDIKEKRVYTVVGFIERPSYRIEGYSDPGYTLISYLTDLNNKSYTVGLVTDKLKNYDKLYESITGVSSKKFNPEVKYDASVHTSLLEYQGYAFSNGMLATLISVGTIVIVIIIITSVFSIKNSFSISVTERFKEYGMLRSVGATKKQIKRSVLFEGLCLGAIGIPLGILSGIFAVFVLIKLVNIILAPSLNGILFVFHISWIPTVLSIVLAVLTIVLSALVPAKRASKITPIEAIRSNNDIKLTKKKIRCPKIIKKIFGVGGVISYKSLKRSKKKYRTTVISLVVSVAIFIALSTFIDYGFKMSSTQYKSLDYNVSVSDRSNNYYDNFKKIANLSGIKKYNISKMVTIDLDSKYLSSFGKEYYDNVFTEVVSLSNKEYARYVKKIGGNLKDYEGKAILADNLMYYSNDKKYEGNVLNVKENDEISLNDKSIVIAKRTTKRPMGYELSMYDGVTMFVTEDTIDKIGEKVYSGGLYIDAKDSEKLCKEIDDLKKTNDSFNGIIYNNYDEYVKQMDSMILVISIFLYGFITVITLIGITNIFNTITTNMALRSKEFAMLRSVGMTKKEFNKMIRLESIFYGVKSLVIGSVIGILLSYLIHKSVANSMVMSFLFPYKAIIISIIFVFVIIGFTMRYSINKINKENIIETIRKDNI